MSASQPGPSKPLRRVSRKFAIVGCVLLLLLGALYLFVSSSFFLEAILLPRLGARFNARLEVGSSSFAPFRQVILRDLKVYTTSSEPLLTARMVRLRYHLFSILSGTYAFEEILLERPQLRIVEHPNGTSNLELVGDGTTKKEQAPKPPPHLSVKQLLVRQGTLQRIKQLGNGRQTLVELDHLDLTAQSVENGQPGQVAFSSHLDVQRSDPASLRETKDTAEGPLAGNFHFSLSERLRPRTVEGTARLEVRQAAGDLSELAGLKGIFLAQITPAEVRELSLTFSQNGQELGRLIAHGPFRLWEPAGKLHVNVQSVDERVLNLLASAENWRFGPTQVHATNTLTVGEGGDRVSLAGTLLVQSLSLQADGQSTPQLHLDLNYAGWANRKTKAALIEQFKLQVEEGQRPVLQAALDQPLQLNWGAQAQAFSESRFQATLSDFHTRRWETLLGTNLPAGTVNARLQASSGEDNRELQFDLEGQITNLEARFGTNTVSLPRITLGAQGMLGRLQQLRLKRYAVEAFAQGRSVLAAKGSGTYELQAKTGHARLEAQASVPLLAQPFASTNVNVTAGNLTASLDLSQQSGRQLVSGSVEVNGLAGNYGNFALPNYFVGLDLRFATTNHLLQLERANLSLNQPRELPAQIQFAGEYQLTNHSGQVQFRIQNLTQDALRPIFAAVLEKRELVSILADGGGTVRFDSGPRTTLQSDLRISNWAMRTPQALGVPLPLGARLHARASLRTNLVELDQFQLDLTPTDRTRNQLLAHGRFSLARRSGFPGQLTVEANQLGLTAYYNMLVGEPRAAAPKPRAGPTTTPGQTEPSPVHLPFGPLNLSLRVDRLYLRALEIAELRLNANFEQDVVELHSLSLLLNGGRVRTQGVFNLGVPGFQYDVSANLGGIPLAPLLGSFAHDPPKLKRGELAAEAKVQGAGVTGGSLQQSLRGQVGVVLTNMDYELFGPKTTSLLEPIAAVLGVPQLTQSPIVGAILECKAKGNGTVAVERLAAHSSAFHTTGQGTVRLADVLTNSPLTIPMEFSLRRSLAQAAGVMPDRVPAGADYVPMPDFLQIQGTLGNPKAQIDKLALTGLFFRGVIPGVGAPSQGILEGLGDILQGEGRSKTPPSPPKSP